MCFFIGGRGLSRVLATDYFRVRGRREEVVGTPCWVGPPIPWGFYRASLAWTSVGQGSGTWKSPN